MRELKFRGYANGRFLFFDLNNDNDFAFYEFYIRVDDSTIEQYTGLKDKNGKEIYEGDVLESTWNGNKAVVVWNDVEGEWEHYADFNAYSKYGDSVVIGNIHENPELLEEEK